MVIASLLRRLVPLVYESDRLAVVVKPAGVDTGDARDGSTTGLVESLSALYPDGGRLFASNRLSRYESGLLMLATSRAEADRIRAELQRGRIELEYVAVVRGRMPKKTLTLAGVPAKATGKVAHRAGPRTGAAQRRPRPPGATVVTLLEQADDRALVRVQTRLENTHALRAALRGAHLRLVGDALHSLARKRASPAETCLHLVRVVCPIPGRKDPLIFKAPPVAFGAALRGEMDVERPLRASLVRRIACLIDPDLDCYRLLSGDAEDVPGVVVERFGNTLVLQLQGNEPALVEQGRRIAKWYMRALDVQAVYLKLFVKGGASSADLHEEHASPEPFLGKAMPERVAVSERGLKFWIYPYDGLNVGLFLDQRENRARLREAAAGKEVLNLFSYTCGFSVAAALGGAKRTVSVDVSTKNLERGRENFALNNVRLVEPSGDAGGVESGPLSPGAHRFFRAGAMEYLARAARKGERFDVVVIDPPTFAHGRRGEHRFSIMEDLAELIQRASAVLRSPGLMLISTNHRRMSHRDLRERLRRGAADRQYEIVDTPSLPPDFVIDRDFAKSMWIRFD